MCLSVILDVVSGSKTDRLRSGSVFLGSEQNSTNLKRVTDHWCMINPDPKYLGICTYLVVQ